MNPTNTVEYGIYKPSKGMRLVHTWTAPKNWKRSTVESKAPTMIDIATHFRFVGDQLWQRTPRKVSP